MQRGKSAAAAKPANARAGRRTSKRPSRAEIERDNKDTSDLISICSTSTDRLEKKYNAAFIEMNRCEDNLAVDKATLAALDKSADSSTATAQVVIWTNYAAEARTAFTEAKAEYNAHLQKLSGYRAQLVRLPKLSQAALREQQERADDSPPKRNVFAVQLDRGRGAFSCITYTELGRVRLASIPYYYLQEQGF